MIVEGLIQFGFINFIGDHTFLSAMVIMVLFLLYKFIVKPFMDAQEYPPEESDIKESGSSKGSS